MRPLITIGCRCLCACLLFVNLGCPFCDCDPDEDVDDIRTSVSATDEGIKVCAFIDGHPPWVTVVKVSYPPNFIFRGFPTDIDRIGNFRIDLGLNGFDPDSNDVGPDAIRARDIDAAYVDSNDNHSWDSSDEVGFFFDRDSNQLIVFIPGSGTMVPGRYDFDFPYNLWTAESLGEENYAFDVQLEMIASDVETVLRNLLLLVNAQVLPHLAFGQAGGFTITAAIVVNNPHGQSVDGEVEFFKDGAPMDVTIGGTTSNEHEFTVGPKSSLRLELNPSGIDPPQVGWAFGYAGQPLEFSSVFSTYTNVTSAAASPQEASPLITGDLQGEAGIAASGVSTSHILNVNKTEAGIDTAFAIANPTSATANMRLTLKGSANAVVAQKELTLGSKSQTARFLEEFFGLALGSFSGTLIIKSDTDIAVLSLQTLNGLQTASLPSGTL